MNWTDLVGRTLNAFDHNPPSERVVKRYLIEAQEDFIRETGCLRRWKWLYIAANADYATLPDDFIELKRAEWNGQKLGHLDVSHPQTLHKTDSTWHFGTPESYFEQQGRLYLVPGPSSADWLALHYVYRPNVLTDSATAYYKLSYDTLTAHFVKGETVTGAAGGSGVVEFDDNNRLAGELTLSSWNSTSYVDDEVLTGSENGVAAANGTEAVFATAGDNPDIEELYRKHLSDYVIAAIMEDKGDRRADRRWNKYYGSREAVRQHYEGRLKVGPGYIIDVMGGPIG